MKKILVVGLTLILATGLNSQLPGRASLMVKLRFYQGSRTVGFEPPTIVTSSYLNPLITANIAASVDEAEEKKQICRVFNLLEARLLTEADLAWEDSAREVTHILRFDSRELYFNIGPVWTLTARKTNSGLPNQFRIAIAEQVGEEKISLLNTELIIPPQNTAVLGFESRDGVPYFLAVHLIFPAATAKKTGDRTATAGGVVSGGVIGGLTGLTAVKAIGEIKPPKLIKKVDPVYPEVARKAGVEGIVILEAETDAEGNVVRATVLRSIPLLDQAAIEAVRQWKYAPTIINGKPTGVIFTVTVNFSLQKQSQ